MDICSLLAGPVWSLNAWAGYGPRLHRGIRVAVPRVYCLILRHLHERITTKVETTDSGRYIYYTDDDRWRIV